MSSEQQRQLSKGVLHLPFDPSEGSTVRVRAIHPSGNSDIAEQNTIITPAADKVTVLPKTD